MELPSNLTRATLTEITWDKKQNALPPVDGAKTIEVQFNPESLKLAYATQKAGNDQSGGASTQYVGQGTTKLSFDLWFDVNAPAPSQVGVNGERVNDVRKLTQQVIYFIEPKETSDKKKFLAPGVRFSWGDAFVFDGTVESIGETLDLFDADGRPLRAQLSVSLTKQKIVIKLDDKVAANVPGMPGPPPGTFVTEPARQGATVQSMAAARGIDDWRPIAQLNGIEQPRLPTVGVTLRFS